MRGATTINAKGSVVVPGFIDLHQHGQDAESYVVKATDGVTTVLELEVGVDDVDAWYAAREGKALINYGASVGHIPVRMRVMHDAGHRAPASTSQPRLTLTRTGLTGIESAVIDNRENEPESYYEALLWPETGEHL